MSSRDICGRLTPTRQAEEGIQAPHPLGIAPGQVVVDGDDVHALAGQRVQVDGQRGHQRLALAGAHLGDLAVVQHHAADQLHVEMAHLQRALAAFAHHGEGLGQQLVERSPPATRLTKFVGLGAQLVVGQGFERSFEDLTFATTCRYCLSSRSLRLPKIEVRSLGNMRGRG